MKYLLFGSPRDLIGLADAMDPKELCKDRQQASNLLESQIHKEQLTSRLAGLRMDTWANHG